MSEEDPDLLEIKMDKDSCLVHDNWLKRKLKELDASIPWKPSLDDGAARRYSTPYVQMSSAELARVVDELEFPIVKIVRNLGQKGANEIMHPVESINTFVADPSEYLKDQVTEAANILGPNEYGNLFFPGAEQELIEKSLSTWSDFLSHVNSENITDIFESIKPLLEVGGDLLEVRAKILADVVAVGLLIYLSNPDQFKNVFFKLLKARSEVNIHSVSQKVGGALKNLSGSKPK